MLRYPVEKRNPVLMEDLNQFCFEIEYTDYKNQSVEIIAFVNSVVNIMTWILSFDFGNVFSLVVSICGGVRL